MNQRILRQLMGILVLTGLLFVFENCVQQPQVENGSFSSVRYTHTGLETSCNTCHASVRPTTLVGTHQFSHMSSTWGGTGDCISCHTTTLWSQGQFSHDPRPTTCQECHQNQRPTTLVGTPAFDHTLNGMGDCVACHNQTTTSFSSLADWAGGEGLPHDLIGVRAITLSVGKPTFSGTTMSSVATQSVTLALQMFHNSAQIPLGGIDTCVACHTGAASGNFTNGRFHTSLGALTVAMSQPTLCLDCHIGAKPVGFVGPVDSANRTPASAKMRHEATTWAKDFLGNWAPTTTAIVPAECSTCHTNPGGVWSGAQFHANMSPQPTSCIACHANSRPPGSFGSPLFNHYTRGGTQDCTVCHTVSTFASVGNWAGGQFPHTAITSCSECHNSQRPTTNTGWQQTVTSATTTMDFTKHGGTTDCYTCHSTTVTHNTMADWQGGNFSHSPAPTTCTNCHTYPVGPVGASNTNHLTQFGPDGNCIACHSNASAFATMANWQGATAGVPPAGLINGDMTKFSWTYWTVNPVNLTLSGNRVLGAVTVSGTKLPMQILHTSNQISNTLLTSCSTCHTSGTTAGSGTRFHTHITPQPTTNCKSCHSPGGVATGIIGPILGSTDTTPNMNHNALYASGQSIVTAQDCSKCHTNPGNKWNDGVFHANIGTNTLNNCTACHGVKMPRTDITAAETYTSSMSVTIPQHMDHLSTYVTQDCVTCHLQKGPANGNSKPWETSVSKFHSVVSSASITTCSECHTLDKPAATVFYASTTISKYAHSTNYQGDMDCFGCHTKKATSNYTDLTKIGVSWTGGMFTHRDQNNNKITSSGACATCHTSFTYNSTIPVWGTTVTCSNCHGSNPGTASYFKHHWVDPSRTGSKGSKNTARSACMQCHGTAPF